MKFRRGIKNRYTTATQPRYISYSVMKSPTRPVTSIDVALHAGVSQSTVSRVFIEGSSVAEKTKQKVFAAARELNYRPNAFARSLTKNESKLIGLVFPDTDYPIHMQTLQYISHELQRFGYAAVLMPWCVDESNHHSIPNIFQYRVDGVIAASATLNNQLYQECEEFNIPIVQYARVADHTNSSYVVSDNYTAGKQAAMLFKKSGAQKAVYLTGDIPTQTNTARQLGFSQGWEKLFGAIPKVIETSYDYHQSQTDIRTMLRIDRPDAVFCATDSLAMSLMDVAKNEFSIIIPQELKVVGFDDIPQASWLNYQLTTFKQDFQRLANEAVAILMELIKDGNAKKIELIIPAELIERAST